MNMPLKNRYWIGIFVLTLLGCTKNEAVEKQSFLISHESLVVDVIAIEDVVNDEPIIVVGHSIENENQINDQNEAHQELLEADYQYVTAFYREQKGQLLELKAVQNHFPTILEDQFGNQYDVFGDAIVGPNAGKKLTPVNSGIGYWFAFASAFPGIGVNGHSEPDLDVSIDFESIQLPNAHICTGAGFDRIHALNDPSFVPRAAINTSALSFLSDDDQIVGVALNGEYKAYPLDILNYHEIVNDEIGGVRVAISYCPLTGTAKVWENQIGYGDFGVSGQLYNSNLLLFDRRSESRWWQLAGMAIIGEQKGIKLIVIPHIEATWKDWAKHFPDTKVLSGNTENGYPYDVFLYGNYPEDHDAILVPVANYSEDLIRAKERVFAVIIGNAAKVYLATDFL
jgi:hypothetical protein